jgi:ribosomal protein S18 acetylase RimI-like enzyme
MELMLDISWENEELKRRLLDSEFILLDQIATKREHRRKGIAEFLIESLAKEFPEKPIASFVAILPVTNKASLDLHEKLGFMRVATFNRPSFLGLQDYESYLLALFPDS